MDHPDPTPLTFCAGTPVEGTCAQRFFQTVAECMQLPATTDCSFDSRPPNASVYCFNGGARGDFTWDPSLPGAQRTIHEVWTHSGTPCLEVDSANSQVAMMREGQIFRLAYDSASNWTLTCPDGSSAPLPGGFRSCGALKGLFLWDCAAGKCTP